MEHSFPFSNWFPSSQPSQLPGIIISGFHSEPKSSEHDEKSCWGTNSLPCASTDLWEPSQCLCLGNWGVPKSPSTAQLLQLAHSPGKISIKGCLEYRTTAEKFQASPVSILQANPSGRARRQKRTLLKAKYIARTTKKDHWGRKETYLTCPQKHSRMSGQCPHLLVLLGIEHKQQLPGNSEHRQGTSFI